MSKNSNDSSRNQQIQQNIQMQQQMRQRREEEEKAKTPTRSFRSVNVDPSQPDQSAGTIKLRSTERISSVQGVRVNENLSEQTITLRNGDQVVLGGSNNNQTYQIIKKNPNDGNSIKFDIDDESEFFKNSSKTNNNLAGEPIKKNYNNDNQQIPTPEQQITKPEQQIKPKDQLIPKPQQQIPKPGQLVNRRLQPDTANSSLRPLPQQPQQSPTSQASSTAKNAAASTVKAKIQQKAKQQALLMLARFAAWFSGFFVTFLIWAIITVFALAIFAALTMFILDQACGFVQQVPFGGIGVPDDVKKVCEYYVKLKGGCFDTAKKEESNSGSANLKCLGEKWDDKEDFVDMYAFKGNVKVKKQVIKEIFKYGKDAGVSEEAKFIALALHPGLSNANNWKETTSNTCFGIVQLCNKTPDSNFFIATNKLSVQQPQDLINSPKLQMQAIDALVKNRKDLLKSAPACIKDKLAGKSPEYQILYIWSDAKCDDLSQIDGVTRGNFADIADRNFSITKCPKFLEKKLSLVEKFAFEDRPYIQNINNNITDNKSENKLTIKSEAQSKNFAQSECELITKTYEPFLVSASNKYQWAPIPMSKYLLGALISRESRSGLILQPKGCTGKGDRGRGHGLTQFDTSSGGSDYGKKSNGNYGSVSMPSGTKIRTKLSGDALKKFGNEEFSWEDCQQSINYGAAHLIEQDGYYGRKIEEKIKRAGIDISKNGNGMFNNIKATRAYMQLLFDSNNAGGAAADDVGNALGVCSIKLDGTVLDFCTSSRDYGKDALDLLVDVAKCFGENLTIEQVLAKSGGGTSSSTACDSNGTNINAQGAEFPLLTKKGSPNKVYYSQPYPEYIGGGGHNGIDMSPTTNGIGETSVVSTVDGQVVAVFLVLSTSCNVTCAQKNQLLVRIKEKDTGFEYTSIHLNPDLPRPKLGELVTKGTKIGQIDAFMFNHLHFEVRLNGVLQQPTEHIKGWNKALQASNVRADSSIIDAALYQKL
jgi:hypothetical protein